MEAASRGNLLETILKFLFPNSRFHPHLPLYSVFSAVRKKKILQCSEHREDASMQISERRAVPWAWLQVTEQLNFYMFTLQPMLTKWSAQLQWSCRVDQAGKLSQTTKRPIDIITPAYYNQAFFLFFFFLMWTLYQSHSWNLKPNPKHNNNHS